MVGGGKPERKQKDVLAPQKKPHIKKTNERPKQRLDPTRAIVPIVYRLTKLKKVIIETMKYTV